MTSAREVPAGGELPLGSELLSRFEIQERRRLGLDIRDEEWCGIYHAVPPATLNHQRLLTDVLVFLMLLQDGLGGGEIVLECGVFRGPNDYRVPDLVYVASGNERVVGRAGITGGAPDLVLEILSPEDETYAKFDFYAAVQVPEVVVLDPVKRAAEVWRLDGATYRAVPAQPDGRRISERLAVSFSTLPGQPPRLHLVDLRNPARSVSL